SSIYEYTTTANELRAFSLHVSTSCASATLSVRVSLPPVWRLIKDQPISLNATKSAPRVLYYKFPEDDSSVRLVVSSESNICAKLSVQNYTCPIKQTSEEVISGLRLTMMRSGAMQISRSQYPLGFYIVLMVLQSDEACDMAAEPEADWLWSAALWGAEAQHRAAHERRKEFTVTLQRPTIVRIPPDVTSLIQDSLSAPYFCPVDLNTDKWGFYQV
ncbi:SID1 transmembrane family member 2-like, partial [Zerene cesonia]|uniref:SID1 transmembrane family member 2-like n=1 Tax=Zerene cesonia TaxID=33412 RepID=UPI0018E54428